MSESEGRVLRVACVGAGSITREFSLRHFQECDEVEVVAVVDLSLPAAELLATDVRYRRAGADIIGSKYNESVDRSSISTPLQDLPEVLATTSLDEALPLCDIVYIATPPLSHAAIALKALSHKKHILLEKPLAISLEDCTAIVDAAEEAYAKHSLVVNVNIGMRHNAALREMSRLMSQEAFGVLQAVSLRLLFMQWPRAWQNQPWVAQRQQGGPLEEVGTHWLFGMLELFGHDCFRDTDCTIAYPDGRGGELCESHCRGKIYLSSGQEVAVTIDSISNEAQSAKKDIYELEVEGSTGESFTLYDFTKLRDREGNELLGSKAVCKEDGTAPGTYGRMECIIELVKAIRGDPEANLVSASQARNAQIIIEAMKRGGVEDS